MKYFILFSMLISANLCFSFEKQEQKAIVDHFIKEYQKSFLKMHYDETNQYDYHYYLGSCHAFHEMIDYVSHMPTLD